MKPLVPRLLRRIAGATAAVAAVALCASCSGSATPVAHTSERLYTDPTGPMAQIMAAWSRDGGPGAANIATFRNAANTPEGIWLAGEPNDGSVVRSITHLATVASEIPLFVVYNLPRRDNCGKYSADSGPTPSGYESFVRQIASSIGAHPAIVIVEPDGLADIVRGCLTQSQSLTRYSLLNYAMATLGSLPHAQVYLDAGNPGMGLGQDTLARALVQAGVYHGRGFAANVANFQTTANSVAWSQHIEQQLAQGVKAVIDTSRNGHGPWTPSGSGATAWCNPPGRAFGPAPQLNPGPPGVAAYLWIKDPGVSDGPCNGGPSAGQLWPAYAAGLAAGNSP